MSLIPRDEFLFPLEQTFNKFFDDFFHNKNTLLKIVYLFDRNENSEYF